MATRTASRSTHSRRSTQQPQPARPAHNCPPRLVDLIERIKGLWPTRTEDGCPVVFMPDLGPSLPWLGFQANGCKFVDPNDAVDDPAEGLLTLARQHVAHLKEFIRNLERDREKNPELYRPQW